MKTSFQVTGIVIVLFIFSATNGRAQFIDDGADRVKTPLEIPFKKIGTIKPRNTKAVVASRITVGCETLDRNLADFNAYKDYLPPLGIKKIRLQAGWAKCEKVKGLYDWKWLDEIIDFAAANGIQPWLETSYGNPIYNGGGGTGLLNSMMTSEEGYGAWDRWVAELVQRYGDRVNEWEIWNEPDHPMQKNLPETTALLNIRTATIIKRIQPSAKIAGLAFASNNDTAYLGRFLKVIADSGKLNLFTWISYHSYNFRPEDSYKGVAALQREIAKYSSVLQLRQGENGAPSGYIPSFALDKYYWTEYSQSKYNLRRLMGDLGRDIETSVFTIIDINYGGSDRVLNTKGLIQSDTSKIAIRPKVAYYAMQNIAAVFDNTLAVIPSFKFIAQPGQSMSVFGHRSTSGKGQLAVLWLDGKIPSNTFTTTAVTISFPQSSFKQPVWVDLLTGSVYQIPASEWKQNGDTAQFSNIPVYDSPVLIAEKKLIFK